MKREEADLSRDYAVHYCEWGVWVVGTHGPTADVSALLKEWSYRGLRFLSLAVAKRLGALVAVCEHVGDEMSWLEELADNERPTP